MKLLEVTMPNCGDHAVGDQFEAEEIPAWAVNKVKVVADDGQEAEQVFVTNPASAAEKPTSEAEQAPAEGKAPAAEQGAANPDAAGSEAPKAADKPAATAEKSK